MGSYERHFSASVIVRSNFTLRRPYTTSFEDKGEPEWGIEPTCPLTLQADAPRLGQAAHTVTSQQAIRVKL